MPAFRSHDPARKFHCDVLGCSASFVKRAHLRRHEMTHTQRRDFTCPGCNRAFSRNDSMARHLRRKHPHLYRSPEAPSASSTTPAERLYTGAAPGAAASSNFVSTSSYSMLALRSPSESAFNSNNSAYQRRAHDPRTLPDPLARTASFPDIYSRDGATHSPKGISSAHWRDSSRAPDAAFLPGAAPPVSVTTNQLQP